MHAANLRSWIIWFIASLFYLYEFIHRVTISVMLPELAESFNASISALGSLSACYFFAYASAQIPVGLLIDRFGTRGLLSIACLAIAISSFVFAWTSQIMVANSARIVIGFASAFAFVACLKLASIWFPARKFAFIIGLTNLFGVVGAIIGGTPFAHSVDNFGWRPVMFVSGLVGIVISLLIWGIVRDSGHTPHKKKIHTPLKYFIDHLMISIKIKQTWFISVLGGLMVAPIAAYSELWGVPFLMDAYDLNRPVAAQISTLTFIGIAIGGPVIGFVSDHLGNRKLPILYGMLGALSSISTILLWKNLPLSLLYILHISFGFFSSSMLLCFSLGSEATVANIRATTIAIINSIIMVFGAILQISCGFLLELSNLNYILSLTPIILCYLFAFISYQHIRDTRCTFKEGDQGCS